jgi:hypothetical protein
LELPDLNSLYCSEFWHTYFPILRLFIGRLFIGPFEQRSVFFLRPWRLWVDCSFPRHSVAWATNPSYVISGQSDHPTIFFFDANNNPVAVNKSYTNTDLLSGFASISSSATAYSVYFGYPDGTEGRTQSFTDISFDLCQLT